MKAVLQEAGMSRQNYHKRYWRYKRKAFYHKRLIHIMHEVRNDHPKMSPEVIYRKIQPESMGRDQFVTLANANGFKVSQKRNYRVTTDSRGVKKLPNEIEGKELTNMNMVWVSDITYYELGGSFVYITTVMDLYSRRVLGGVLSRSLKAEETTIKALTMALRTRNTGSYNWNLIFHSDGGSQYYSRAFKNLREQYQIKGSMAEIVYDNPHAERVLGTIKNDYLIPYGAVSYEQLEKDLARTMNLYNRDRPHEGCMGMAPVEFEQYICGLKEGKRPKVKVKFLEKSTFSTDVHKRKKKQKRKINDGSNM